MTKGDWTMKGAKPILELADFFPTAAQMAGYDSHLAGDGLALVDMAEVRKQHQRELGNATLDAQRKAEAAARAKATEDIQAEVIDREARARFKAEYDHYDAERAKWQAQKAKLEAEVERLKRREATLVQQLTGKPRLAPEMFTGPLKEPKVTETPVEAFELPEGW
jgi:multidrug efflux pump subunit AcrA (membrane-fusion protein)